MNNLLFPFSPHFFPLIFNQKSHFFNIIKQGRLCFSYSCRLKCPEKKKVFTSQQFYFTNLTNLQNQDSIKKCNWNNIAGKLLATMSMSFSSILVYCYSHTQETKCYTGPTAYKINTLHLYIVLFFNK